VSELRFCSEGKIAFNTGRDRRPTRPSWTTSDAVLTRSFYEDQRDDLGKEELKEDCEGHSREWVDGLMVSVMCRGRNARKKMVGRGLMRMVW
jgi:hypothetical protein